MDRPSRRQSAATDPRIDFQGRLNTDPLPLEITIACERIRRAWTADDRSARAPHLSPRVGWQVPVIRMYSFDSLPADEEGR